MLNIVTLVGVLQDTPELKEFESGTKAAFITLRVTKPFRTIEGMYDSDFIKCILWEGIAQNTCEYCQKGDIIGVRGRLTNKTDEIVIDADGKQYKKKISQIQVIAERVAFICTSKRRMTDGSDEPFQDYSLNEDRKI